MRKDSPALAFDQGSPRHSAQPFARFATIVLIAITGLVAGLRLAGPAPDYRNYELQYLIDSVTPLRFIWQASDPIYHSLSFAFGRLNLEFSIFVFFVAFFTCTIKIAAFKKISCNHIVLLILYISYLYWLHEYVQIRLGMALGVTLFAIYAGGRFRYPLLLVAILIHSSVLLVVAGYLLVFVGVQRPIAAIIAGVVLLVTLLSQNVFGLIEQRVLEYQDLTAQGRFNEINVFSAMPLIMIVSLFAVLLRRRKLDADMAEMILAGMGVISFYAFLSTPVFAFRLLELFMPFYLIFMAKFWRYNEIKLLVVFYVIVGLRAVFFTADPLIGGSMSA